MISRDQEFQYYIEHPIRGRIAGPFTRKGLRCHITQDRRHWKVYVGKSDYYIVGYQLTKFTANMSIPFVMNESEEK